MTIVTELNCYNQLLIALQAKADLGIISKADAEKEGIMYANKIYELKEAELNQLGFTLSHHEATEQKPKDYWYTTDKLTGKKYTRKSKRELIDFIYEDVRDNNSVRKCFEKAIARKSEGGAQKEKTLMALQNDYNRFISAEFGSRDIRSITLDELKKYTKNEVCAYKNDITENTLSESGWGKYKVIIDLIFDFAESEGIVPYSIARAISKKDFQKFIKIKNSEDRIGEEYFSPQEIETIKAKVRSKMKNKCFKGFYATGYGILLAILTGMRVSELCALKWADVDLKRRKIHIHRQQLYIDNKPRVYYEVNYTKNEKGVPQGGRYYPIDNELDC